MSEQNTRYVDRAGTYLCRVKKPGNGWFGESAEKQTPFIRIPCFVADASSDQDGKEIVWYGWLSDKAFDKTIEKLVTAFPGWDGDLAALENGSFGFEGSDCEIVAESEDFEGKPRIKAAWLNSVGGGGGKEMDKAKVQSLVSKLNNRAKALAKAASKGSPGPTPKPVVTAPTTPKPAPLDAEDDDIPF